jgi:hypothetical protein
MLENLKNLDNEIQAVDTLIVAVSPRLSAERLAWTRVKAALADIQKLRYSIETILGEADILCKNYQVLLSRHK